MTSQSTILNYVLFPTGHDSALLVIDTGRSPNSECNPHVDMHFLQQFPCASLTMRQAPGSTCSIFKVSVSDIINVTYWVSGHVRQKSYEILPNFKLRIHINKKEPYCSIFECPPRCQNPHTNSLKIEEQDLDALFSGQWPEWLCPAMETQLHHWRIHNVALFYRYTPWKMSRADVWRCIKSAPSEALRRFSDMLTDTQRRICCQNAPRAAASFAIESLSPAARRNAIEEFPGDILRQASEKLTAAELAKIRCRLASKEKPDLTRVLNYLSDPPRH